MDDKQRTAFDQWFDSELDPELNLTPGDKELCRHAWQAALSHAEGEAVAEVTTEPDYWSRGHFYEGRKKDIKIIKGLEDIPVGTKLYTHPVPQVAVPEGWTDRHTRVTRFALWRLINEGYYRANVAAQKGQPGTADDAAALLDDVERAEEARNMLAARIRAGKEDRT